MGCVSVQEAHARTKYMSEHWWVYIAQCADGSLYTGITTDVERRMAEHNDAKIGAKYTRSRQPVALAYAESAASRSEALKRESALKKRTRQEKLALISQQSRQNGVL